VAAEAIVFAAERRQYWIGTPTVKAIPGNRVTPGLLDRIMATRTWSGQFTAERISLTRPDNLFAPVEGLYDTYGIFSDRSEAFSLQAKLARHKWAVAGGAAGLAAVFFAGVLEAIKSRR
jgi:hypothetical protein